MNFKSRFGASQLGLQNTKPQLRRGFAKAKKKHETPDFTHFDLSRLVPSKKAIKTTWNVTTRTQAAPEKFMPKKYIKKNLQTSGASELQCGVSCKSFKRMKKSLPQEFDCRLRIVAIQARIWQSATVCVRIFEFMQKELS